ncbi:MAG: FGGY family carbohydrate kinase, partial [Nocardioides sp.]
MSAAGMRWVLAVDLGSTGLKVGLVSTRGEVGWWASEPLETTYVESGPHAGAATQDAEHWWRRVVALAKQGLASGDIDPQAVDGVAVTGQWASTIPVDESGVPVGPCLMWNDTRGAARS